MLPSDNKQGRRQRHLASKWILSTHAGNVCTLFHINVACILIVYHSVQLIECEWGSCVRENVKEIKERVLGRLGRNGLWGFPQILET